MDRSSGILLHITSLPGPHGIGDLGPAAFTWIDQLAAAKQTWWQMLPLGPTGYADSPYQCLSAFAGNPNLISLELLADEGFINLHNVPQLLWPPGEVDYDRVTPLKTKATQLAFQAFQNSSASKSKTACAEFRETNAAWLDPFALFLVLKEQHGGLPWYEWPIEYRHYESSAVSRAARELAPATEIHKFRQYLFFEQWQKLKAYATGRGIKFIGDMPIFISADSADAWSHPELFQLDKQRHPSHVAGVPPDYFSETGQLWGNPLYAWERHKETGFAWWIDRLRATLQLVDLVRLDHFRGFEAYWSVPAGSKTAEPGRWVQGPGAELFSALQSALRSLPLIAEDLGVITPPVDALRKSFDLPGMSILQFAFGGAQEDRFFPHNYDRRCVVYTGTHDNETTVGWYENLKPSERDLFESYAPGASADPAWTLIRLAWSSVCDLAVAPLQDLLRLGNEARMNLPGTAEGNWRWRLDPALISPTILTRLADLTTTYQREPRATPTS